MPVLIAAMDLEASEKPVLVVQPIAILLLGSIKVNFELVSSNRTLVNSTQDSLTKVETLEIDGVSYEKNPDSVAVSEMEPIEGRVKARSGLPIHPPSVKRGEK